MPNSGDDLKRAAALPALSQKSVMQRRVRTKPMVMALGSYTVTQIAGLVAGKTGAPITPAVWQPVCAVVGIAAFISASPVIVLGLQLIGIRLYRAFGLITDSSYERMRKTVEKAFEEKIQSK